VNDTVGYARYELLRTFRNKRLYIFSFAFPLVLYYAIAGPNRHEHDIGGTGIGASLYFMVGLAAFGGMTAVLGSGARIAAERAVGWNRQLRLTPLSNRTYFRVKVLTAYAMALVTLALLFVAGLTMGVHLRAGNWLQMTLLMLVGLAPFAAIGILLGHLLTADSIGPAIGGVTAVFALLEACGSRCRTARCTRSQRRCPLTGSFRRATWGSAAAAGVRPAGSWSPRGPWSRPQPPAAPTRATPSASERLTLQQL
jgi:ABC-2 type transport system permease protein